MDFLFVLFPGLIFFFAGIIMRIYPPKEINSFYGYRTKSSMKTKERWDFAQKYSSLELIKLGVILVVLGFVNIRIQNSENTGLFVLITLIVAAIALLIRVEFAIKKKFAEN